MVTKKKVGESTDKIPSPQVYQGQVRAIRQQPEGAQGPYEGGGVQVRAGGAHPHPTAHQEPGQGPDHLTHHRQDHSQFSHTLSHS